MKAKNVNKLFALLELHSGCQWTGELSVHERFILTLQLRGAGMISKSTADKILAELKA